MAFILFGVKFRINSHQYGSLNTNDTGPSGMLSAKTTVKIPCTNDKRDYITAVLHTENRKESHNERPPVFTDIKDIKGGVIFKLNQPMTRQALSELITHNAIMAENEAQSLVAGLGKPRLSSPFTNLTASP